MRGYIETVTRTLRAPSRRTERAHRRPRGRRSTFLPLSDDMVLRGLTH